MFTQSRRSPGQRRWAALNWRCIWLAFILVFGISTNALAAKKGLIIGFTGSSAVTYLELEMKAKGLTVTKIQASKDAVYPDNLIPDSLSEYRMVWDVSVEGVASPGNLLTDKKRAYTRPIWRQAVRCSWRAKIKVSRDVTNRFQPS